jgi:hypothetical protein
MAKSNSKRKARSDKFPLTLHKTGQFCKKIKGKLIKDKQIDDPNPDEPEPKRVDKKLTP